MSKVNKQYSYISLAQATDIVASIGDKVTTLVTGPMGCGKSSILKVLAERFPNHHAIYADCTTMDVGDIAMPKFMNVNGQDVVSYVPNTLFGTHLDKPIILMLDELGKAAKSVTNALLRIMLERRINDKALPDGSIIFATTNRGLEGLGDNIPAHVRNRLCQINITKPKPIQWIEEYGINAGIHPIILGAVIEFPSMLEDDIYVEDPNMNHYIFHPKSPRTAFVTPRSLEKASDILKSTEHLPDDVRIHALMGTVGEAAATDILTLIKLNDTLPSWEAVIKNPEDTKIPKGAAASCMMCAKAVQRVERDTFDAWMTYVQRMGKEVQALFARSVMRSAKVSIATTHKGFTKWAADNSFLFS